jgi:tRNA threonylcarbamoyladenosine biosynthesis protein TsaE
MRALSFASPEETLGFAHHLGQSLKPGAIIALFGELGAGKTTFLKGLIPAINGMSADEVSSPTFTYLHIYPGPIFHFDLYRLKSAEEFSALGFEEYFSMDGIVCLEWAERIAPLLPAHTLRIFIEHATENQRCINIS